MVIVRTKNPTGRTGLRLVSPIITPGELDVHWALHGISICPEDGPTPEAPEASYRRKDLAAASRGGYRCEGTNVLGEDKVPLGTVIAALERAHRDTGTGVLGSLPRAQMARALEHLRRIARAEKS